MNSRAARPGTAPGRRFAVSHVALPLALGAAVLWGIDAAGLDRALSDAFYDPETRTFPLRHAWVLDVVMHHWAKYLVGTLGALCLAGYALSFVLPPLAAHRRTLLFLALAMGLSTLTVSGLKRVFVRHCPWDIDVYGGFAPYASLLAATPDGLKPGHCFPGGHASTGFALMAFHFAFYPHRRGLAAAALLLGLAAGLGLGLGRVMQGAHFLSHNVWSGLICWLVIVGLWIAMRPRPGEPFPEPIPARV
ncbi:MAG: phosphatase PAP2 family protein [Pseudomonadota bacterium]